MLIFLEVTQSFARWRMRTGNFHWTLTSAAASANYEQRVRTSNSSVELSAYLPLNLECERFHIPPFINLTGNFSWAWMNHFCRYEKNWALRGGRDFGNGWNECKQWVVYHKLFSFADPLERSLISFFFRSCLAFLISVAIFWAPSSGKRVADLFLPRAGNSSVTIPEKH